MPGFWSRISSIVSPNRAAIPASESPETTTYSEQAGWSGHGSRRTNGSRPRYSVWPVTMTARVADLGVQGEDDGQREQVAADDPRHRVAALDDVQEAARVVRALREGEQRVVRVEGRAGDGWLGRRRHCGRGGRARRCRRRSRRRRHGRDDRRRRRLGGSGGRRLGAGDGDRPARRDRHLEAAATRHERDREDGAGGHEQGRRKDRRGQGAPFELPGRAVHSPPRRFGWPGTLVPFHRGRAVLGSARLRRLFRRIRAEGVSSRWRPPNPPMALPLPVEAVDPARSVAPRAASDPPLHLPTADPGRADGRAAVRRRVPLPRSEAGDPARRPRLGDADLQRLHGGAHLPAGRGLTRSFRAWAESTPVRSPDADGRRPPRRGVLRRDRDLLLARRAPEDPRALQPGPLGIVARGAVLRPSDIGTQSSPRADA